MGRRSNWVKSVRTSQTSSAPAVDKRVKTYRQFTHYKSEVRAKKCEKETLYRYRCGERLADMDFVCEESFREHQSLRNHMKTMHQATGRAVIFYVRGKVDSLNARGAIAAYLRSTTTQAEANQRDTDIDQGMHLARGSRDFWTTVLGKRTRLPDSRPNKAEPQEQEACRLRKPPQKLRELIVEAISSGPDQGMSVLEIMQFVGTHYPWYGQPSQKARLRERVEVSLSSNRAEAKVKPFEENQGRWRMTAIYRSQLEEAESKPVLTGFLLSSLTE